MQVINVDTSKAPRKVQMMIRDLPLMLSGKKNDIYGVRQAFWGGFAHSMFASISINYFKKSQLIPDELGNIWPDLSPTTKAYRRAPRTRGRLGLLSSSQKKKWWSVYKQQKAIALNRKMSLAQAKVVAAKKAWVEVKKIGGRTKIETYGNEKFLVLVHKGKLLDSLAAGAFNGTQYRARSRNQIFTITRRGLTIGTRVKYANQHHEPKNEFIPQRRLWPKRMRPWLAKAMKAGVIAATLKLASKL